MKVLLNKHNKHIRLKVVEFAETAEELLLKIQDELSKDEQASLNDIGHIKRKKEWLSVRVLLKEMLGKYTPIVYDEYRNPYIQEPYEISITHSKNIVGITLSKKKYTGIDSEILSDRILRTAHKFIDPEQLENFPSHSFIQHCYLHWCGKETLYKIKGGGGIDFLHNLQLSYQKIGTQGKVKGIFSSHNIREVYEISYEFLSLQNKTILITWH